ncbi:hypothetical protein D3Y59_11795 [Hymenobacter oligotrophus]|uniref:Uncharacterized protein n=1 Tax=Hymenobacter oligotrophus TaxID=2319843 RepID=A0A3B7RTW4_9BACT|nr:hypothetical protein D3Y59_11795 [Hymenobacter oligotrophus]
MGKFRGAKSEAEGKNKYRRNSAIDISLGFVHSLFHLGRLRSGRRTARIHMSKKARMWPCLPEFRVFKVYNLICLV